MKDNSELYRLIKDTIINLQDNNISFEQYLEVQSKFYQYSVSNMLLILAQNSEASVLKDDLSWQRESVRISGKAKPINILEPFFNSSGEVIGYNCKDMYDISDTNAKSKRKKYDNRTILKAFLHNNIAEIKGIDDFDDNTINSIYKINKDGHNVIYLRRGLDFNDIFKEISLELANIEIGSKPNEELDKFKKKAIAYLVCKSHGLNIKDLKIENFPILFREISDVQAKKILGEIRNAVANINEGIDDYLRSINRSKNYIR